MGAWSEYRPGNFVCWLYAFTTVSSHQLQNEAQQVISSTARFFSCHLLRLISYHFQHFYIHLTSDSSHSHYNSHILYFPNTVCLTLADSYCFLPWVMLSNCLACLSSLLQCTSYWSCAIAIKIILFFIFRFTDRRQKGRRFWTNWI